MIFHRARPTETRLPNVWLITFSDLVCLILSFFVLLLSFSRIDPAEFRHATRSVRSAFGTTGTAAISSRFNAPAAVRPAAENAARMIRRELQILGVHNSIGIAFDPAGNLRVTLPDAFLFEAGKGDLAPEALSILSRMADILARFPGAQIEVRGHTAAEPLTPGEHAPDNYALSHQRAHAVALHLHEVARIPMSQFEIIARGADEPRGANDTKEGRAANRRVEVIVDGLDRAGQAEIPSLLNSPRSRP